MKPSPLTKEKGIDRRRITEGDLGYGEILFFEEDVRLAVEYALQMIEKYRQVKDNEGELNIRIALIICKEIIKKAFPSVQEEKQ